METFTHKLVLESGVSNSSRICFLNKKYRIYYGIVISGFVGVQGPTNIPKTGRWKKMGDEVRGMLPTFSLRSAPPREPQALKLKQAGFC